MATYQEYLNQVTKDYEPTRRAIQNQINAIPGQQQIAVGDINKQYGLQQQNLDRQRDDYNYNAQTTAANKGLGWSNIGSNYAANYAKNSYTPAVTQLQTNQQKDINSANETYKNRQFELENYLNSLINENSQYARLLAQADADREAQERASQRAAAAQAAAMGNYLSGGNSAQSNLTIRNRLQQMADAGDNKAKLALQYVGDDGRYNINWNSQGLNAALGVNQLANSLGVRNQNQLANLLDQYGFANAYTGGNANASRLGTWYY